MTYNSHINKKIELLFITSISSTCYQYIIKLLIIMSQSKYCKVCQDAGKPEAEYKSHFTRQSKDPNSTVVCPTLLALECRYCFKSGHTVKYCPTLKQKSTPIKSSKPTEIKPQHKGKPINTNSFAYLQWDTDEEDDEKPVTITNTNGNKNEKTTVEEEAYPSLTYFRPSYKSTPTPSTLNYAAALTTPKLQIEVDVEVEEELIPIPAALEPVQKQVKEKIEKKLAPWANKIKQEMRNMNWADMDSDTDEELELELAAKYENSAW